MTQYMKKDVKCHVCNSECSIAFSTLDERYDSTPEKEFKIYECLKCGAGQTVPRPKNISDYYIEEYYDKRITKEDNQRILDRLSIRYESLLGIDKVVQDKKGRLLEIGCGPGHDLNYLAEQGWEVIGVEPNKSAVEMGQSHYDLTIHHGTLDDVVNQLDTSSFDVVLLNHVFEHIPNPRETICCIKKVLTPAGSVVIEVPNFDSILRRMLGEFWGDHDVPRHVYHYTPKSLDILMGEKGFQQINASYYKGALLGAAWTSDYITTRLGIPTRAACFFPFFMPIGLLLGLRKKTRFRHTYTLNELV